MKSNILVLAVLIIGIGVGATSLYAIESTLIDFSRLTADTPAGDPEDNEATLFGFADLYSTSVGVNLSDAEREQINLSLGVKDWTILFNSSARIPQNIRSSGVRQVMVRSSAEQFADNTLLGVRLIFPQARAHASALITPPYKIPRTNQVTRRDGQEVNFDGLGRLRNVGQIESISLDAYGLNYPNRISVLIEEQDGVIREHLLGNLQFAGWNTLVWNNPAYVPPSEDEEPLPLAPTPLYPIDIPIITFHGFRVYRNMLNPYNEFVGYFKEVRVTYDEATNVDSDIDSEGVWHVDRERENQIKRVNYIRNGPQVLYESIQKRKRYKGEE